MLTGSCPRGGSGGFTGFASQLRRFRKRPALWQPHPTRCQRLTWGFKTSSAVTAGWDFTLSLHTRAPRPRSVASSRGPCPYSLSSIPIANLQNDNAGTQLVFFPARIFCQSPWFWDAPGSRWFEMLQAPPRQAYDTYCHYAKRPLGPRDPGHGVCVFKTERSPIPHTSSPMTATKSDQPLRPQALTSKNWCYGIKLKFLITVSLRWLPSELQGQKFMHSLGIQRKIMKTVVQLFSSDWRATGSARFPSHETPLPTPALQTTWN